MTSVDAGGDTAKQRRVSAGLVELSVERDLARDLGVARMTLRRAVDQLVAEERLIPRQGSGTIVTSPKLTQQLTATSFSADMRARGLRPGGRTVFARVSPAGMTRGPARRTPARERPPRAPGSHRRRGADGSGRPPRSTRGRGTGRARGHRPAGKAGSRLDSRPRRRRNGRECPHQERRSRPRRRRPAGGGTA